MNEPRLSCGRCLRPIFREGERYVRTCYCHWLAQRAVALGTNRVGWAPEPAATVAPPPSGEGWSAMYSGFA